LKALAGGLVPIHEEHEARLERSINLQDWASMDVYEKALIVANRRIRIAIQNQQAEAEVRDAKRKSRRK